MAESELKKLKLEKRERDVSESNMQRQLVDKLLLASCGINLEKVAVVNIETLKHAKVPIEHKEDFIAHAIVTMLDLYESRDTTGDVKIVSGTGTVFKIHKFLLVQQSPVLKAAVEVDMRKKEQNTVKLEGFSDKAVASLIDFLYKGWTSAIAEESHEMLQIAHLYQVEKLVEICWDHILKFLEEETVFESLILADRLGAQDRKIQAAKYFKRNHATLSKSPAFEVFVRENTTLYLEVCKI